MASEGDTQIPGPVSEVVTRDTVNRETDTDSANSKMETVETTSNQRAAGDGMTGITTSSKQELPDEENSLNEETVKNETVEGDDVTCAMPTIDCPLLPQQVAGAAQSTPTVSSQPLNPAAPEFVWPHPPPRPSSSLHPLEFEEEDEEKEEEAVGERSVFLYRSCDLPLPCVMCEWSSGEGVSGEGVRSGGWECARDQLLRHLLQTHKIVIHQVELISSLRRYCEYWKTRFSMDHISTLCPVIRTNTHRSDPAPSEDLYLMSDALPEDRQLRQSLQHQRLEAILAVQQVERRQSDFIRSCLFCSFVARGNRSVLIQHMLYDHSFNIGQADNIVFVNEFLDLIQHKLDNLLCLCCEKLFKDNATLKEHMRKKQHKKINPNNTEYDRFYVVNYLEIGKTWRGLQEEREEREERGQEESWDDWRGSQPQLHCLFCSSSSSSLSLLTCHMTTAHNFDLDAVVQTHSLDYYGQVKIVNYIRRQVHRLRCPHCSHQCQSQAHLLLHLEVKGHCCLPPDKPTWDHAQYLLPTYENDALLYTLEDRAAPHPSPPHHLTTSPDHTQPTS